MSRRYPALLIDDMLDSIATIADYIAEKTAEEILDSRLHKDAIIRNLEVLGEAANQLTSDVQSLSPDIPWPRLISLRNRLIHEYHGVNWKVVLPIIMEELPLLEQQLIQLQKQVPELTD